MTAAETQTPRTLLLSSVAEGAINDHSLALRMLSKTLDSHATLERALSEANDALGQQGILHVHTVNALRDSLERTVARATTAESEAAGLRERVAVLEGDASVTAKMLKLLLEGFTHPKPPTHVEWEQIRRHAKKLLGDSAIRALATKQENGND